MATPNHPRKEQHGTYFVQDRSNKEERTRLRIQDQLLTTGMGGVLPEQADRTRLHSLLDVGCGSGDWLIEVAKIYPHMTRLVGVDISSKMLGYARAQADAEGVGERIEFLEMDALQKLDFPDGSFDLVNERFGDSFIRTWDWPGFLEECRRVVRPGGVIRVTECDLTENNSPALNRIYDLFLHALYNAGHFFRQERRGVIDELGSLLRRYGIENVQTCVHPIDCSAGTPAWQPYYENVQHGFRTLLPFFRKWTRVPDDYEAIYQQALEDMQQAGFGVTWTLLTAWGTNRG